MTYILSIQLLLEKELSLLNYSWVKSTILELENENSDTILFYNFSFCSRKLKGATKLFYCINNCPSMNLVEWTRVYLLLSFNSITSKTFFDIFKKLKETSDTQETIALYKALSLYPFSDELNHSAEEGVRSNMKEVFESVSLNNFFPSEHFNENAWNQMILKALFIEAPLYKVQNFDLRKNETLSQMVIDYALERISASRSINPELWRCVTLLVNPTIRAYWRTLLASGNEIEKSAVILSITNQSSEIRDEFLGSSVSVSSLKN